MKNLNEFLNEGKEEGKLLKGKELIKKQRAFYKGLKPGDKVIYNSSSIKKGFEKGKEYEVVSTKSDKDFQISVLITNGKQKIRVSTTVGLLPA